MGPESAIDSDEIERRVVTVLALPPELPIYVDDTLMDLPWIILGGGSRSLKIKTSPEVFRKLPGATVVAGLSNPI